MRNNKLLFEKINLAIEDDGKFNKFIELYKNKNNKFKAIKLDQPQKITYEKKIKKLQVKHIYSNT